MRTGVIEQAEDGARVTMTDVAEVAGVSTATVSKVINSRPGIALKTRAAVLKAAGDLGYRKGSPAITPGMSILFVTSTWTPYSATILAGAVETATGRGLHIVVKSVGDAARGEWIDSAATSGYAGIIGVTVRADAEWIERARQVSLPLIFIDPEETLAPRANTISSANWAAARNAVEQLLNLGHKRVGVLGGSERSNANLERIEGCRSALESRGLGLHEAYVVSGAFDYDHGYSGAKALLGASPRPTAVFALADVLAAGALRAFYETGLVVPGDISLVSFDDTETAQQLTPALTTVIQPLRQMGQAAVDRISTSSGYPRMAAPSIRLDTEFIYRSSASSPE